MQTGSGLDAIQRQRLCRARHRARRILAQLTGEAGNCLSDLIRSMWPPPRVAGQPPFPRLRLPARQMPSVLKLGVQGCSTVGAKITTFWMARVTAT
jgi:hypothetical protein